MKSRKIQFLNPIPNYFKSSNKRAYLAAPHLPKNLRLKAKYISSIRTKTIFKFLTEGYNLFLSGVENIWVKYRKLGTLPRQFDTYYSSCIHPKSVFKDWGFTVCDGTVGYRNTTNNLILINKLMDHCDAGCDGQASLNWILKEEYRIRWNKSKHGFRIGRSYHKNSTKLNQLNFIYCQKLKK